MGVSKGTKADRAEKAYFKLIEAGIRIPLRELARRSEELIGEVVSYEAIRKAAAKEGWIQKARILLEESDPEEHKRLCLMLDIAYARIMEAEEPKDLSSLARAYLNLINNATLDVLHMEEERITDVRDKIFYFVKEMGEVMLGIYLSRLYHVYGQLRKKMEADFTIIEENGVDPDALLLGV